MRLLAGAEREDRADSDTPQVAAGPTRANNTPPLPQPVTLRSRPRARVAKARQLSVEQVTQLVNEATQKPLLSFLGQPVVNILQLTMSLDALTDK